MNDYFSMYLFFGKLWAKLQPTNLLNLTTEYLKLVHWNIEMAGFLFYGQIHYFILVHFAIIMPKTFLIVSFG
jgi:hypothetical protein